MSEPQQNQFTTGPLGRIYLKTAAPIIFVMGMNGLITVADALFLGIYVGPEALAGVTLMFPIYMLIVALSTLVSNGMSSQLARFLGAGDREAARRVFAGAQGLALALSGALIALFFVAGEAMAQLAAGGNATLQALGLIYLKITVLFSPLLFVLGVHSDALRNEGRVGFMAAMSLLVSLANIAFNYLLIAVLELGVAGSAYGTAAAQALGLSIILAYRLSGRAELAANVVLRYPLYGRWQRTLALGAPQSLNFLGLAIGSASILIALQWVGAPAYADTVTAYGIITRVMTFAYLPLLGLSFAMQTITGNNYGAQLWHRSDASIRIALCCALIYCAAVQLVLLFGAGAIGGLFVEDPAVIAEIRRILPMTTALFFLAGPLMMTASYFQAIGSATLAAILGLTRAYAFAIPLTFLMPLLIGEPGIWVASPMAEFLLLCLTLTVLTRVSRRSGRRFGPFHAPQVATL